MAGTAFARKGEPTLRNVRPFHFFVAIVAHIHDAVSAVVRAAAARGCKRLGSLNL